MNIDPANKFRLPAAQVACLDAIELQITDHAGRRLLWAVAQKVIASNRAIIAGPQGRLFFAPRTARVDALEALEGLARQQEDHQQTVLEAILRHACAGFVAADQLIEAATLRASKSTQRAAQLKLRAAAFEHEADSLELRLSQLGGSLACSSAAPVVRSGTARVELEAESSAAESATQQLSAFVALWAEEVKSLHEDGATISSLRHRFFADTVRLQEDVWMTVSRAGRGGAPGNAWLADLTFPGLRGFPSCQAQRSADLLGRARAEISDYHTMGLALSQRHRDQAADLSGQQVSLCRQAENALREALLQARRAAELAVEQQAQLATSEVRLTAVRAQMTALAADHLCLRAGLVPRTAVPAETKAIQPCPTLKRFR